MLDNKRADLNLCSLVGHVLVAHPVIREKNLKKSVVLVGDCHNNSAIGVVLNHPRCRLLRDTNLSYRSSELDNIPVYDGGPQDRRLLTLVAWVLQDHHLELYYSITEKQALELKKQFDNVQIRGFIGYIGISNIAQEIDKGLWIVYSADELLGANIKQDKLWDRLVQLKCPNAVI